MIGSPHGYVWNGECLIKKKGNSRPDGIDNVSWKSMSKRQRAEAVVEHERKIQAVYEAEYEAAVKAVPAMPVLIGKCEEHRERLLPLLNKKLLEVSSDMYAVVAKVLSPKEVSTNPAAQAALDKEWQKLVDKGCWVEKKVREYEAVASEAKKDSAKVHFGNIFEIGTLKGAELKEGDPNRKYKGRSVFQGNKVVDENSDHALFAEMSSSPASMEAGKILDVFGSQPGYTIQQADAKQAYTQALFTGVATWVRLPRNRWPKSWKGMKDPVVPLKLALYGHPDSGGIWEKHCETQLKKVGFEAVLTDIWKSVFYHPVKKLLLVVYVDDFKLAGPKDNIKEGWKTISSVIDMDPPEDIGRYFGCMHRHEHGLMLPKDAHPFRHVFEPETKTATPQPEPKIIGTSILRTFLQSDTTTIQEEDCMYRTRTMQGFSPPLALDDTLWLLSLTSVFRTIQMTLVTATSRSGGAAKPTLTSQAGTKKVSSWLLQLPARVSLFGTSLKLRKRSSRASS